jgi:DNA invertase Pin-like site-specific DNA recombinase
MARKAFSYWRCSTKQQLDGGSEARQLALANEACERNGWILDKTLSLAEKGRSAYSGAHIAKGELGKLLAAIEQKTIPPGSVLIVESLDRLSRQILSTAVEVFKTILAGKVSIHVCRYGRTYEPDCINDPMTMTEIHWVFHLAHLESLQKSQRINWTFDQKRKTLTEKKWSSISFGWLSPKTVKEGKYTRVIGWKVDDDKADIVRTIFAKAIHDNFGIPSITRYLNQNKIPPIGHKRKSSSGRWTTSYVAKILSTRAVLGEFQPHKIKDGKRVKDKDQLAIAGYFPGIIDEPTWQAAQDAINGRRILDKAPQGRPSRNIFAGLLHCVNDGSGMQYYQSRNSGGLRSTKNFQGAKDSCRLTFPYEPFENLTLSVLSELTPEDLIGGHKADDTKRKLTTAQSKLHRIDQNLSVVETELTADPEDFGGLVKTKKNLMAQRSDLLQAIEVLRQLGQPTDLRACQNVIKSIEATLTDDMRERLKTRLATLLARIDVELEPVEMKVKGRGRFSPVQATLKMCFRNGAVCHVGLLPQEDRTYHVVRLNPDDTVIIGKTGEFITGKVNPKFVEEVLAGEG